MFYVYVLRSQINKQLYIGYTSDLRKRINEHNDGKNLSTKSRRPFELLYYEAYTYQEEALEREKFYKGGRGHEILYKILFKTLADRNGKSSDSEDKQFK